jgi:N-acetylglutamate synthase-like GNAT family acetyltransferase
MSLQLFERPQAIVRPMDGARPHEAAGALELRTATAADARAIHRLISEHVASDHLLPRTLEDIAARAGGFVVVARDGSVVGCAELAPLSPQVAEVRSLVVDAAARGLGAGRAILDALVDRATDAGHTRLCAFTHRPAYFIRLGFSIVPHLWVREKVVTDCVDCPLFRSCGQHAVELSLVDGGRPRLHEARVA